MCYRITPVGILINVQNQPQKHCVFENAFSGVCVTLCGMHDPIGEA